VLDGYTDRTLEDIWLTTQRVMSCICEEFNIKFLSILQANVFSEGQPLLFIDKCAKAIWEFANDHQGYLNLCNMKSIYDKAGRLIQNTSWILNFRRIFGKNPAPNLCCLRHFIWFLDCINISGSYSINMAIKRKREKSVPYHGEVKNGLGYIGIIKT
jgi:hypothetical protein